MNLRQRLGFHDEVTRTQAALACLAWFLMLPAFGVMLIAEWAEDRRAA